MACRTDSTQLLRRHHLRVTQQRLALLEALRHGSDHATAVNLLDLARDDVSELDPSTVYRTLSQLRDLGLVSQTDLGTGERTYHWRGDTPHHHLVCTECGRIEQLPHDLLRTVADRVHHDFGFEAENRPLGRLRTLPQLRREWRPPMSALPEALIRPRCRRRSGDARHRRRRSRDRRPAAADPRHGPLRARLDRPARRTRCGRRQAAPAPPSACSAQPRSLPTTSGRPPPSAAPPPSNSCTTSRSSTTTSRTRTNSAAAAPTVWKVWGVSQGDQRRRRRSASSPTSRCSAPPAPAPRRRPSSTPPRDSTAQRCA